MDNRHAAGPADVGQVFDGRVVRESADGEVRTMHLEDGSGFLCDCIGIVRGVGPVCRADLDQSRRGLFEYVRDSEPASYFHCFAA